MENGVPIAVSAARVIQRDVRIRDKTGKGKVSPNTFASILAHPGKPISRKLAVAGVGDAVCTIWHHLNLHSVKTSVNMSTRVAFPAAVHAGRQAKLWHRSSPLSEGTISVQTSGATSLRDVVCDAAVHLQGLDFPTATPKVMLAERTFWEKATAIHVFCEKGTFRGDRYAPHWHDLVRLDAAGFADRAIADRAIATAVAEHKTAFFAEKNGAGKPINYHDAVSGGLQLVPSDGALSRLTADYQHMIDDGLFLDDAEPFETLMAHCHEIERKANAR